MNSNVGLPDTPDWDNPLLIGFEQAHILYRNASLVDVFGHTKGRLCYLATPYSKVCVSEGGVWNESASVFCAAFAADWARFFAVSGITAISPIVQSNEMIGADNGKTLDPLDAEFWTNWYRPLLSGCCAVIVPPIQGWQDSVGIWRAVRFAVQAMKPVFLIDPSEVWRLSRRIPK